MFPAKLVVTTAVYECRTSYLTHASVLLFQTLIQPAWQPTQVNTRLSVAECTCVDEQSSSKGKKNSAKSNGHSSSFKWTCNTCTKPCSKQCQIDGSQCQKVNDLSIMAMCAIQSTVHVTRFKITASKTKIQCSRLSSLSRGLWLSGRIPGTSALRLRFQTPQTAFGS